MTQINQYKKDMAATREVVLKKIGWQEEQLNNFYIDQANAFLKMYFNEDEIPVEAFYKCEIFWQWWKNEWYMRDKTFVSHSDVIDRTRLEDIYCYMHSANYLHKKPQRPVMEKMMGIVTYELQKQIQSENTAVYAVQGMINNLQKQAS